MKCILFMLSFLLALPVAAYQTGAANRANFGAAAQQQPAAQQQTGYRSFSNYNNRFGQGVQTGTVQTSVAGSVVKDFSDPAKQPVGKKAAAQPSAKGGKTTVATSSAAAAQSSSASATMPANMDPSAMMQQVQGMMQSMQAASGGNASAGGAAASTGGQSGVVPAMPDMSSLMNMMNTGAAPASTPAGK